MGSIIALVVPERSGMGCSTYRQPRLHHSGLVPDSGKGECQAKSSVFSNPISTIKVIALPNINFRQSSSLKTLLVSEFSCW